ncbi:MAG TPA: response regulator [Candidatus Polarisedimenticolia bacterium]|nr:response regulator [Candidatus Polarisedimenticolia bacterium]
MARILVVDDQEDIRETTSLALRQGGHDVVTAADGMEAIAAVREHRPDLVLMDIEMPRLDGWEALRMLRMDETGRHLPVAMFTILFDLREKVRALKYGAQDYITKPFSIDELLERVDHILGSVAAGGLEGR